LTNNINNNLFRMNTKIENSIYKSAYMIFGQSIVIILLFSFYPYQPQSILCRLANFSLQIGSGNYSVVNSHWQLVSDLV